MTWFKVWLHKDTIATISEQRDAVTSLINARVLSDDVTARLCESAHALAAIDDAVRAAALGENLREENQ